MFCQIQWALSTSSIIAAQESELCGIHLDVQENKSITRSPKDCEQSVCTLELWHLHAPHSIPGWGLGSGVFVHASQRMLRNQNQASRWILLGRDLSWDTPQVGSDFQANGALIYSWCFNSSEKWPKKRRECIKPDPGCPICPSCLKSGMILVSTWLPTSSNTWEPKQRLDKMEVQENTTTTLNMSSLSRKLNCPCRTGEETSPAPTACCWDPWLQVLATVKHAASHQKLWTTPTFSSVCLRPRMLFCCSPTLPIFPPSLNKQKPCIGLRLGKENGGAGNRASSLQLDASCLPSPPWKPWGVRWVTTGPQSGGSQMQLSDVESFESSTA